LTPHAPAADDDIILARVLIGETATDFARITRSLLWRGPSRAAPFPK
jgi:hypothetical protein